MSKFDALAVKLREMFKIEQSELDFGIYRILNAKNQEIEDYISNTLKQRVESELIENSKRQIELLEQDIEKLRDSILNARMRVENSPAYLEMMEKLDSLNKSVNISENLVFPSLLTFFSRYYDNGDFISQRRYKGDTYSIPYQGEEVAFYWANHDQYYVKSSESFTVYTFKLSDGRSVEFQLVSANTAKDNNKDLNKKRFFTLAKERIVEYEDEESESVEVGIVPIMESEKKLTINFEFNEFDGQLKQEDLVSEAIKTIESDDTIKENWTELLKLDPTEKNPNRTIIERHVNSYTQKNTSDYFIHKDLNKFLRRELDNFIKTELMNLDNIEAENAFLIIEERLRAIQCIRTIGCELIDFLSSIEEFQKKLWLKRKFVVSTHYCITLDRVPSELYPSIVSNNSQWQKWHELGFRDTSEPGDIQELKNTPHLMVDTSLFERTFQAKLLESISDIDDNIDGELIHGDNFQALKLLEQKYAGRISCIYIDPPYNSDSIPIIYKNNFKSSSWISFIESRLSIATKLLKNRSGYVSIAIDDNEIDNLQQLLRAKFNNFTQFTCAVEHYKGGVGRKNVSLTHEYNIFMVQGNEDVLRGNECEHEIRIRGFRRSGTGDNNYRKGSPNSFFAVLVDTTTSQVVGIEKPPEKGDEYPTVDTPEGYKRVYPIDNNGAERVWSLSYNSTKEHIEADDGVILCKEEAIQRKYDDTGRRKFLKSFWKSNKFAAFIHGTNRLTDLFGINGLFSNPKSIYTVQVAIDAGTFNCKEPIIMDFFAGSGTTAHAVINLNRKDNFQRKYLLVEQGEYFDTVLVPGIQKFVYSNKWKKGQPDSSNNGISHTFKVMKIEGFEDTLNNLELTPLTANQGNLISKMNDANRNKYLIKYMLEIESRGSNLSVSDFQKPFDYKLNIATNCSGTYDKVSVDLAETFNYLLGLSVTNYFENTQDGYILITGRLPSSEKVLVFWRDCEIIGNKEILAKINNHVKELADYDFLYINGDNNINFNKEDLESKESNPQNLIMRQIEPVFFDAMFEMRG